MEDVNLTLSYPVDTSISTFVTAGYEKHDFHALGAAPREGPVRWAARGRPRPARLAASIGHRYFGKTYSLDAGYRLRNMFWTLNYSEDITSTRGEFLSLPPAALSDFLYDLWAADTRSTQTSASHPAVSGDFADAGPERQCQLLQSPLLFAEAGAALWRLQHAAHHRGLASRQHRPYGADQQRD
jgi:uncharacterized protein (PEP-CTERM system associated)